MTGGTWAVGEREEMKMIKMGEIPYHDDRVSSN